MNNEMALAAAFLDEAPQAAAQELQRLPFREAAAVVDLLPTQLCLPVLRSMIPWNTARVLEMASVEKSAAILSQFGFPDSVSLIRLVAPELREALFVAMPKRQARRLRRALEYPQHQVGAWIDTEIPTLRVSDTVREALRVLRDADNASHVFLVTGDEEMFAGLIPVRELFRSEQTAALAELRAIALEPVSNRAALASVSLDERWDHVLHLPVVGRRKNLLGGLTRKTIRMALSEQRVRSPAGSNSLIREIAAAFSVSVEGLAKTVVSRTGQGSDSGIRGRL